MNSDEDPPFFGSKEEEWLMMILVMGNCLLDLFAVFDLDLEPIRVDNSCCFCFFCLSTVGVKYYLYESRNFNEGHLFNNCHSC